MGEALLKSEAREHLAALEEALLRLHLPKDSGRDASVDAVDVAEGGLDALGAGELSRGKARLVPLLLLRGRGHLRLLLLGLDGLLDGLNVPQLLALLVDDSLLNVALGVLEHVSQMPLRLIVQLSAHVGEPSPLKLRRFARSLLLHIVGEDLLEVGHRILELVGLLGVE